MILERDDADAGRFPAIDVLRSLSRTAPEVYGPDEQAMVLRARQLLKAHAEIADLLQLGAYRPGGDPLADDAICLKTALEALLAQAPDERARLRATLGCGGAGG
ncbi:MAG TPA: hypothetical protein VFZ01_02620 [Geminicoccaceae bacterium]